MAADVTDPVAVERAIGMILDEFGKLDILVNNAGVNVRRPPYRTSPNCRAPSRHSDARISLSPAQAPCPLLPPPPALSPPAALGAHVPTPACVIHASSPATTASPLALRSAMIPRATPTPAPTSHIARPRSPHRITAACCSRQSRCPHPSIP